MLRTDNWQLFKWNFGRNVTDSDRLLNCSKLALVLEFNILFILKAGSHIRRIGTKDVHTSEISTRTYRRRRSVSPQFPSPSWVTVRVGLDTLICLSADKAILPFFLCSCSRSCSCLCVYLCLCLCWCRFTHTTLRHRHRHKRKCKHKTKEELSSLLFACVVRVNQPYHLRGQWAFLFSFFSFMRLLLMWWRGEKDEHWD